MSPTAALSPGTLAAAQAFQGIRLSRDEREGLWSYGFPATGWSVAAGQRHGLPVAAMFGRSGAHCGHAPGEPCEVHMPNPVERLAAAVTANPAGARGLVIEARTRAAGLRSARETAVAAKIDALADLVEAILRESV